MDQVERLLHLNNQLGEGPIWNVSEHALYWVNIEGNCFYRYHPVTGAQERFDVGQPIGVLCFRKSGGLAMALRDGFALWDFQAQSLKFIANPEPGKPQARFNDGAVDRLGRFWAGTLAPGATSSLYRLDPDLSVHTMETGITVSNGIGWSPDNRTMYYCDSRIHMIYAYDFDLASGTITNRRTFVHTPNDSSTPDGLTVDSEGFVWCARWGGWKVVRYDPMGKVEREIRLPVEYPTSCAFGGTALDELYITSAWTRLNDAQRKEQPDAGDVFRLKTNVKGLPEPLFAG
jgi:sugar lactone lactonase YvrE